MKFSLNNILLKYSIFMQYIHFQWIQDFDNKLKAYMEVMKFIQLINVKMATIVDILTFISMRTTTTKLS